MLFTPPFVEGWRSKLRLQNRKACVALYSLTEQVEISSLTQVVEGDPEKRALLNATSHALNFAYPVEINTLLDVRHSVAGPQRQ